MPECRLTRALNGPMRNSTPGPTFRVRFEEGTSADAAFRVKKVTLPTSKLVTTGRGRLLFLRAPAGLKYLQHAHPPSGAPPFRLTDPVIGAVKSSGELEERLQRLAE